MRRKIFWPVFLTAAAFIVICSAVISAVLSAWLEASARERLSLQMDMLSSSFELPENAGQADPANDGFRITVISAGGEVLYDSAGIDDDYFSYEDVRQAAETGSGEYEYNTENAMRLVICRSQRLSDGSVLRVCAQ